tara:strand:- start:1403 stop:1633 length:231 start_codon:yes stop_codon:yes gene_type:complete
MENEKKASLKKLRLDKEEEVNTELKEVKKDIGKDTMDKVSKINLKALVFISSWNKYSNGSKISSIYHKIVNSIRRK